MRIRLLLFLILTSGLSPSAHAGMIDFSGQARASAGWNEIDTAFADSAFYDDQDVSLRLMALVPAGDHLTLECHYELIRRQGELLEWIDRYGDDIPAVRLLLSSSDASEDNRRLFDLTHTLEESSDARTLHRIDRLVASWEDDRFRIRIGRQALSWGYGLVFNPMDVLNPFAPTDRIRDYKSGDDMIVAETMGGRYADAQVALAGRRDSETGDYSEKASAGAVHVNGRAAGLEWTLMAGENADEPILGAGMSGYLKSAAWRADLVRSFTANDPDTPDFFSGVLNIDLSWGWGNRNWYGFVEWFYDGLGEIDSSSTWTKTAFQQRLLRGERFTLGKSYLAAHVQMEAHPLVNLLLSALINLNDASCLMQPHLTWDCLSNLRIMAGADLPMGPDDSEFGGVAIAPRRYYVTLTGYF